MLKFSLAIGIVDFLLVELVGTSGVVLVGGDLEGEEVSRGCNLENNFSSLGLLSVLARSEICPRAYF